MRRFLNKNDLKKFVFFFFISNCVINEKNPGFGRLHYLTLRDKLTSRPILKNNTKNKIFRNKNENEFV